MARRRTGPLEQIIEVASLLPWKVSAALAPITFLTLTFVSQQFRTSAGGAAGGDVLAPIVHSAFTTMADLARWIGLAVLLLGAGLSWWKGRHPAELLSGAVEEPAALDEMSWRDFERLVGEAYRRNGYAVAERGGDGPDGGVDLVLRRGGRETLVQCKRWRRQRVGVSPIRELRGVMAERGATDGIVVGLAGFTDDAEGFARAAGIRLVDREGLIKLVNSIRTSESHPETNAETAVTSDAERCPRCGSVMVRRIARQGPHSGRPFLGCSRYPVCRGIVELS
jgi:restriction system protein